MPRRFPLPRFTRHPAIYLTSAIALLVGIVPVTGSPPVAAAPSVTVVSEVGGEAEEQLIVTFGRPLDVAVDELVVPIQLAEPSIANRNAATAGTDVSTAQSSLVFPAGSTTGTVELAVVDDGLLEGPEDIDILLGLPGGVERATVTIADSSRLNLTIRPGTGLLDEGESTTARVRSAAAPVNPIYLTVRTEDGTAVGGVDYVPLDVAVTIPAGATESELVTVSSIDDDTGDLYEASFWLRVFAGAPADVAVDDRPIASWFLRVLDDDEYLRFVRNAGQDDAPIHRVLVDEPASDSVEIELPIELLFDRPPYGGISGEIFLEPITAGPNALDPSIPAAELGSDLTVGRTPFPFDVAPPPPLVVTINADDVDEPVAERIRFGLRHEMFCDCGWSRLVDDVVEIVISDADADPPPFEFSVQSDDVIAENDGPLTLTVRRDAPEAAPAELRIVTADGTATAGADYIGIDTTIDLGADPFAAAQLDIELIDDDVPDAAQLETFTVQVFHVDSGLPDAATVPVAEQTITIEDDDPLFAFSSPSTAVARPESGVREVPLAVDALFDD